MCRTHIIKSRCVPIFSEGHDEASPGQDSGYSLMVRIPFEFLGKKVAAGDTIGFNVHITDKNDKSDLRLWGTFSGATRLQFANPSEWAQLVFLPPDKPYGLKVRTAILGILILGAIWNFPGNPKTAKETNLRGQAYGAESGRTFPKSN